MTFKGEGKCSSDISVKLPFGVTLICVVKKGIFPVSAISIGGLGNDVWVMNEGCNLSISLALCCYLFHSHHVLVIFNCQSAQLVNLTKKTGMKNHPKSPFPLSVSFYKAKISILLLISLGFSFGFPLEHH